MKTYLAKTGGGEVKATQLTESFSKNTEALALMPSGFKVLNRVNKDREIFSYRGQRGKIDDWFIIPGPEKLGKSVQYFLAHEHFEAQFYTNPVQTEKPNNPQFQINNQTGEPLEVESHETPGGIVVTITNPDGPKQTAVDFELTLKELIAAQMQKGLTVTEAVGTLHLCAAEITNQLFNPQPSLKDAFN